MYQVVIDDKDGLMDLVALMAQHVEAVYTVRMTLETDNARLAEAVAALSGRPAVSVDVLARGTYRAITATVESQDEPAAGGKVELTCAICGKPFRARTHAAKVCSQPECGRAMQKIYAERSKAKNLARIASLTQGGGETISVQPEPEAATSESPFGLWRILGGSRHLLEYPETEIRAMMTHGAIREGQQVQDLATKMISVVMGGELAAVMWTPELRKEPLPEAVVRASLPAMAA
jgi:hypothetical protein